MPCQHCQLPLPVPSHPLKRFCSGNCQRAVHRRSRGVRERPKGRQPVPYRPVEPVELTCCHCGTGFLGRYPYADRPRYCAPLCRYRAEQARRAADGRKDEQNAKRRINQERHPCVDCGKGIWTGERCGPCYRGAVKAKRRIPAGDRLATYERDGWVCKLCGDPVAHEEAVPHPLAPTIDHRIPLAECIRRFGIDYVDGMHNWQTAHYRCNCQKGKKETV